MILLKESILISNQTLKLSALLVSAVLISACTPPVETDGAASPNTAETTAAKSAPDLQTEDEKAAYTLGFGAGQSMAESVSYVADAGVPLDSALVEKGFIDGLNQSATMDQETLRATMQSLQTRVTSAMQEKAEMEAQENTALGQAYLEANKAKEGVVVLESGLQYTVLTPGTGKSPSTDDKVRVHYKGTLIDGTQFDSSYDRGEPAEFGVTQVIRGWTEALQLMKEGAKWQLTIPAELAYGSSSRPTIPANSVLVFDVELLEVIAD